MTSSQVARLLRARRSGRGKWQAKCPSHHDRTPSLSITDMGAGRTRLHCFVGCHQSDVLKAAGLSWKDLRSGEAEPQIRERMTLEDERKRLERRLGLAMMLGAIEPQKRNYWAATVKGIRAELKQLAAKMEPEKVWRWYQKQKFHKAVQRGDTERLWRELYGMDTAGAGTNRGEEAVRPDGVCGGSPELQIGWIWPRFEKGVRRG